MSDNDLSITLQLIRSMLLLRLIDPDNSVNDPTVTDRLPIPLNDGTFDLSLFTPRLPAQPM